MKKILLIMFIVLIPFFVMAEGLGSSSKIITAYKRHMSEGQIPVEELTLRLIDSSNNEFFNSSDVGLPLESRNTDYPAFSWILSGNIFTGIQMQIKFYPMYWEHDNTAAAIPYSVTLSHTSTRIGNTSIIVNSTSNVPNASTNDFATGYSFKYADSVTFSPWDATNKKCSFNVSNSFQTATITLNMSTNTQIFDSSGAATDSYDLSVCDYWNRLGQAIINLGNGADFSDFDEGFYYADVQVVIAKV